VTVVGAGSASGAALLGSMPPRTITITEVATTGWPDAPVSASCVDLASATPTATFGTLVANQLTIPTANSIAGADLRCTFVNDRRPVVSGRVFTDDGQGAGIANDGVFNGREAGLNDVPVTLGDCAANVHGSTRTDATGRYRLVVPLAAVAGSPLCVQTPQVTSRIATGASVATTPLTNGSTVAVAGVGYAYSTGGGAERIAFAWPGIGGSSLAGIDFASVPISSFASSQIGTGVAGTTVDYHHVFTAGTAGAVAFSVPDTAPQPGAAAWSRRIVADPGCTGKLQAGAATLFPPSTTLAVTPGQVVCVILRESIPPVAPAGSRQETRVQAGFVFSHARPALTATYVLEDVTTVSDQSLNLLKEVRNLSATETGFTVTNKARPGDTLEYRITYTNRAATPIHTLTINDTTPAFTTFKSATATELPGSLTSCAKRTPASTAVPVECAGSQAAGGRGALEWKFAGELAPGGSGAVLFQVVVD
jgi:uncharacterized repeat protein (TIGR01451 family)